MIANRRRGRANGPRIAAALLVVLAIAALAPRDVAAHFFLDEPASWREQSALGDPQKTGPCGDEGTAAQTGAITAYQTGQTITITLHETVFHPGHFRVALAVADRSELPPPPAVTPGATACGSVPIMDPPVFPVLADGVLPHTSPLSGAQTIDVTLPPGVTCDHCTLQVVQFMSSHGAPCFYYHCADLSITDVVVDSGTELDASVMTTDASTPIDAGSTARMDAGDPAPTESSSCGCTTPGRASGSRPVVAAALAALAAALVVRRRRG